MKKIFFRFFFIYFILATALWQMFEFIPGLNSITYFINDAFVPLVTFCNDYLFHVKDKLTIDGGGSGDTSYAWAYFYTTLLLAVLGSLIWTVLERKSRNYEKLEWILKNILRYYIIIIAFLYGTIKLFAQQMPEPGLSQLATPLGDFLPMRLSWMFFGYSSPYQIFSGVMEMMVAILLLYRRTIPTGLLLGFAVFLNVFILNLCFDIPVKLFSMHLVIYCLYLIVSDGQHFVNFFWKNKPTGKLTSYDWVITKKYVRIGRVIFKLVIVSLGVLSLVQSWFWEKQQNEIKAQQPIEVGIYSIRNFRKNNVVQTISTDNNLLWKEFIFENDGKGSLNTGDTLFLQKYGRGYFMYSVKPKKNIIVFNALNDKDKVLFELNYKKTSNKNLQLWGKVKQDSVFIELQKTDKKFPLMEKQFHWISEANR
jgi:hypothetical protein